jgi:hypothetical protein
VELSSLYVGHLSKPLFLTSDLNCSSAQGMCVH